MTTRVTINIRRGVKSCEREASQGELKEEMAPDGLLFRDMAVYSGMGEARQLLFKALVVVISARNGGRAAVVFACDSN